MANMPKQQPNAALLAMHEADRERGINPLAPTPVVEIPASRPPAPEFVIPRPDWDEEVRLAKEAERERRVAEAAALLETVDPPGQPTPPAAPRKRGWRRGEAA
jgi:hypothetical protein